MLMAIYYLLSPAAQFSTQSNEISFCQDTRKKMADGDSTSGGVELMCVPADGWGFAVCSDQNSGQQLAGVDVHYMDPSLQLAWAERPAGQQQLCQLTPNQVQLCRRNLQATSLTQD